MLEIIIYAFSIMYSPGPANMLALHAGIHGQGKRAFPYCIGVAIAMLLLFLLVSYLGSEFLPSSFQRLLAVLGGAYIAYLGIKIMLSSFQPKQEAVNDTQTSFKMGLTLQLLNPKAPIAIIPIVGVQFPRAGIEGEQMIVWSLLLSVIACGAPTVYLIVGNYFKKNAMNIHFMNGFNRLMAVMLFYVAYRFCFG